MKYDLFAGMGGGFGGATYQETRDFNDEEAANNAAYEIACEIFDSYAGLHGVMGWEECMEEARDNISESDFNTPDEYGVALEEYADEVYKEERESWIDSWAEESTGEYDE